MRKAALLLIFLLLVVNVFAQKSGWDKLQTDDGELAMLMPAGCYSNFYDHNGITVYEPDGRTVYQLTEMRLISCYRDGALLNVEIYETAWAKAAAKVLREKLQINGDQLKLGKDFYAVGQVEEKADYTLERRLVASDRRVYLITAATRRAPNETMRTFLDSVQFADDYSAAEMDKNSVLISSLENRVPEVVSEKDAADADKKTLVGDVPTEDDKTLKKIIVLSRPAPSYTSAARKNRTTGRLVLRLTFGTEGRITRLQVVRDLPNGLVREAVVAALRIKFLPEERSGKPQTVTKTVEYKFGIY